MSPNTARLENALATIGELKGLVRGQMDRLDDVQRDIEAVVEALVEGTVDQGFDDLPPVSDHRRNNRPGRPPKIDTDPELAAFIRARIDRLTFQAIADEVADHFPPARCVGKSAIHAWWKRHRG